MSKIGGPILALLIWTKTDNNAGMNLLVKMQKTVLNLRIDREIQTIYNWHMYAKRSWRLLAGAAN